MHIKSSAVPLILQEGDGERRIRRPGGPAGSGSVSDGPHAVVFIPRETWVSIENTGHTPIHLYALFSRQGFENFLLSVPNVEIWGMNIRSQRANSWLGSTARMLRVMQESTYVISNDESGVILVCLHCPPVEHVSDFDRSVVNSRT
jgi:hypothetical protein